MAKRHTVHWKGPRPPAGLAAEAPALGFDLTSEGLGSAVVLVYTHRDEEIPRPPEASPPWLWVAKRSVSQARAIEAVRRGAYDVVSLESEDAALEIERRLKEILSIPRSPGRTGLFVGKSKTSQRVLEQAARAAETSMPVLLTGETGTGKEVCARLIHEWSARRSHRFVPINCAAIPNELMEAELFGYARGAFSGASQRYEGLLVAAAGGTVFLDEIDDTPLSLQVKLLRVLRGSSGEPSRRERVARGGLSHHCRDERDLPRLIEAGQFGADLYERLAIVSIQLPRLRERLEDLEDLVAHFLAKYYRDEPDGARRGRVRRVSPLALEALAPTPGRGTCASCATCCTRLSFTNTRGRSFSSPTYPNGFWGRSGRPILVDSGLVDRAAIARRIERGP